MKLIFFDEVKNAEDYSHYHIGAICVLEDNLKGIEEMVSSLSEETFGTKGLSRETEFHAAEIYHRKRAFRDWNNFGDRIEVLKKLIEILSLAEVELIDIQINCSKLAASQLPEEIAFMFLCERSNDLVRKSKSLGMLIGDRESDRQSERYATNLSDYKVNGTDFAFGREITHLVDSVHFTHSHLSRFLQLADVYAWIQQFKNRNRGSENPYHKAMLDILEADDINLGPAKYKEWPK